MRKCVRLMVLLFAVFKVLVLVLRCVRSMRLMRTLICVVLRRRCVLTCVMIRYWIVVLVLVSTSRMTIWCVAMRPIRCPTVLVLVCRLLMARVTVKKLNVACGLVSRFMCRCCLFYWHRRRKIPTG